MDARVLASGDREQGADVLASGDREQGAEAPRQQRNLLMAMLQRSLKGFMSILPNAIENLRGFANLQVEEDDDKLVGWQKSLRA